MPKGLAMWDEGKGLSMLLRVVYPGRWKLELFCFMKLLGPPLFLAE
jgi:hypothetical protein